jgi:hypothetical protein
MANHMNEYMNPLHTAEENTQILVPNLAPQNIKYVFNNKKIEMSINIRISF